MTLNEYVDRSLNIWVEGKCILSSEIDTLTPSQIIRLISDFIECGLEKNDQ